MAATKRHRTVPSDAGTLTEMKRETPSGERVSSPAALVVTSVVFRMIGRQAWCKASFSCNIPSPTTFADKIIPSSLD